MRYVGSKRSLAERILKEIVARKNHRDIYWEPFVGGCNSFCIIAPKFPIAYGSDIHEDLILMWDRALSGWIPPSDICEDEYNLFKYDEPSALRGFVGFGASFGGKWFGGYARGYNYFRMRDYMEETSRAIVADIRRLKETDAEISFECHSYEAVSANSRYVIYCDPPYEDTLGYAGTPKFNHAQFWQWAHKQHENGALVIVSGYKAPDDWTCIAEFTHKVNVSYQHNNRRSTVERLFTPT